MVIYSVKLENVRIKMASGLRFHRLEVPSPGSCGSRCLNVSATKAFTAISACGSPGAFPAAAVVSEFSIFVTS